MALSNTVITPGLRKTKNNYPKDRKRKELKDCKLLSWFVKITKEYKDFPRYCGCGCREIIKIKKTHKYTGIPKYIDKHHTKGRKESKK